MKGRLFILTFYLLLAPVKGLAWGFDVTTVEALIDDHKDVREKMIIRNTVEEGNAILHSWTNDTIKGYKKVADLLDKYDKCFDILEAILHGATTVVKLHNNYRVVSDRISDSRRLLERFTNKCLLNGNIRPSDKIIIDIGNDMIQGVEEDISQLYKSLKNLLAIQGAGGALGLTHISTKDMLEILDNIDRCFDHITKIVNNGYIRLRGYILARLGPFFRDVLSRTRPTKELCQDALSRWISVTRRVVVN